MTIENWATSSGTWDVARNWSPVGVPATADTAIFATGNALAYTVSASTLSADVANSVSISGDNVVLAGTISVQSLSVVANGELGIYSFIDDAAVYADDVYIGQGTTNHAILPTDIDISSLLEDGSALIDGTNGQPATAGVVEAGEWENSQGLTVSGSGALLQMDQGTLLDGPAGLLIDLGASVQLQYSTIEGGITLAGGTLEGASTIAAPLTVEGAGNVVSGSAITIGSVMDGAIPGGLIIGGGATTLDAASDFSLGATLVSGLLELAAIGAAGSGAITFAQGSTATLKIDTGAMPENLIDGFGLNDSIDLAAIAYSPNVVVSSAGGTIDVSEAGAVLAQLTLAGTAPQLLATMDPYGGTALSILNTQAAGASGSWAAPAEWLPAGPPQSGEGVQIAAPGSYTIVVDGSQYAGAVRIGVSGATLQIDSASTLTAGSIVEVDAGALVIAGTLVTGSLAISNATIDISGVINPNRLLEFEGIPSGGALLTAAGGEIDLIGTAAPETFGIYLQAPESLILNSGNSSISATLQTPGTIISNGVVSVRGSAGTDLIDSGTLSDGMTASDVAFGTAASAELEMLGASVQTAATIQAGSGADTILGYGGASTIFGGSGQLTFIGLGASEEIDPDNNIYPTLPYVAQIDGGTGAVVAYGGTAVTESIAGANLFFGGSGGNNILVSGDGASTLVGGGAGDLLVATGSASNLLVAGSGNETLTAGGSTGANLLYGGPGSNLIVAGSGNETIVAGSGNETIFGGILQLTNIVATSGQDLIVAQSGASYIRAGSGASIVFAGSGDIFGVVNGQAGGELDIVGFGVGSDFLQLQGYAANAATAALGSATVAGGNTVFTLPDATRVILYGVTNLTASSFI